MTGRVTSNRVWIQKSMGKTDPVVLASWYEARPTVHRLVDYAGEDSLWPVTGCGRTLSMTSPILRYDHAMKIGPRCKRCFRDY